ncbi:MAG TPA: ATP-binding protein [Polyangiaceae bacterium]|nr:ATP-binding protein [Polyangiaceae bacterium]
MWPRLATARLRALAQQFPAVLLLGARQVGKTTLARTTFRGFPYVDLEEPRSKALFLDDPTFQIEARAKPSLILDEAQSVPEVFAALRGIIDSRRREMSRFILLGSAQPSLVRGVSESLAGRVGILDLDPLTAAEVSRGRERRPWEQLWLRGGFPDALRGGDFRDWWEAYLRTYVERDLPALGVGADPILLRRLLTMLAHQQGGVSNTSALGTALGVSHNTVRRYIDVLEQTYLVRRLFPYFRNVGKRLVKAPKVYLRDSGLLHHLLNIATLEELDSHPVRGASWETFVLEELIRREQVKHPHSRIYFWRTSAGAEIDLVIERGNERFAVEVKSAHADKPRAIRALEAAASDIDAQHAFFIDMGTGRTPLRPRMERRGFTEALDWLPTLDPG